MLDYEKAFEEALETPEGAEEQVKSGKFVIDNMDKCEWATKKKAKLVAEMEKVNALVDERIRRMEEWRAEQLKPLLNDIQHFENMIRPFAEQTIAAQKKKKSFKLPNGATISITAGKKDIKKIDDEALKKFLSDNNYNDYLETKTTTTAKWGEFKKVLHVDEETNQVISPDGEIVECCRVEQGEDKYSVDVTKVEV